VALTQTASALPFFILALPAGAIGDIVDRRKVILFTEIWMVVVAVALAVMTIAGKISPVLLLILTFALSAGDAFETPTWRAVLPELVEKGRSPSGVSAQRHRIQLRPGSGTRAGWFRYRICGDRRRIPVEHLVLLRGYSRRSSLEAARC
jgi:MFS family permease